MKIPSKKSSKKSFFSIKAKVALLCTCSIIVAVIVTFTTMALASKKIITNSTEITLQDLANTYSNNLSDTIMQVSHSADYMMSSSAIASFVESGGTGNSADVEALAKMVLDSNSSFEDVSIVDEKGIVLYSSNSKLIGTDISGETYFTNMVSSGLDTQSNVYTSESSGDSCITFAIPLRSNMGMIGGTPSATGTTAGSTTSDTTGTTDASSTTANAAVPTGAANATTGMMMGNGGQDVAVTDFTGAIIASVKVSAFDSVLSDLTVSNYDTGYAYILDSEGNVIYHPDETLVGTKLNVKEIDNLLTQVKNGTIPESSIITYTYNNVKKYAGFSIDSDNQWVIFVGADQAEVMNSLNAVSKDTLLTTIILVVLLSIIAYLFTGTITKSIKKITQLINKTAELDFTEDQTFQRLSQQKDETGEMSRAIEKMREVMKTMILHISEVSGKINESSNSLNHISLSVNEHASDNSATAEELSASMQETAATTEQIHAAIEQISTNSNDITEKVVLGAKLSEDIINRATELMASTTKATTKTQKIYEEVKVKTDAAIEQAKAVEKISILTKTIKDIASQTNLLALNASIEAARAGEAGSGFTVVAKEIGVLANQSAKTVSHITDTVEEVYEAVENMSKSLEQTLNFLGKNVLSDYDTFLNSSAKYNEDAGIMSKTMENIQSQIDLLNTNVLGIADSISEINMMISEASTGVNDVAEKNTDIVALTSQTQNMSNENTEYANSLKEIVEKFKL
ncbi:MAG TPA: methyl-accepting chemotaxis protein [Mobilitalea sp.]|nr:methyl-accepting chemotaxis protein [Mobilitalea sp.]